MNRDPFFNQIIERLQGTLDPHLFELCAADLLRSAYPTLVPIRGGDDAGMDGAIADAQGEPFPLVTTTGKDVIGNLTRNLKSYLDRGGTRKKVVLATSQHLSQRRRQNLFDRASEWGFTLINIHDRDAIASLLYRSPEWCRELLNLTGDPSPLAAVPRTTRPQLLLSLVGRDEDLRWLHESSGDRLLIGQPGVGKTSLLRSLVNEGEALFVISEDRGEIAAALRAHEDPITLIVDDAHIYAHVIEDLIHLRLQTGAEFSILASCWPSFKETIAGLLNLTQDEIHNIELLSRDEIVEVVNLAGIQGPNPLIREIVDQASGRPGLAVTLAFLCLQGGVPDLVSGAAIQRTLFKVLDDLNFQPRVRFVLASFAIGGDVGMSANDVADFTGLSRAEVWEIVTQLHESGFVYDFSPGYVSVQPPALRHVLVRDVFFSNASAPPIVSFLSKVPDLSEAAITLLGIRARGGRIPEQLLIDVLRVADSSQAWNEYAWMGKQEATWVFANYPERVLSLARPLLNHIPNMVILTLLKHAVADQRPLNAYSDHPIRLLHDWIRNAPPRTGQAVFRRKALLKAVRHWLLSGENVDVGLKGLELTLTPVFELTSIDPGMGYTLTFQSDLLSADELTDISDLWLEVLAIIKEVQIEHWEPIQNLIENWAYPGRATRLQPTSDGNYKQMRAHAVRMLQDVISLAHHRPGLMRWAVTVADSLDAEIEVPVDKEFLILYPKREREEWRSARESQATATWELATEWSQEDPQTIVKKLAFFEAEARSAGLNYPRSTPELCAKLAKQVSSPIVWLKVLMDEIVTADLILPFLLRAAQTQEIEWQEYALICLDRPNYQVATILLTLRMEDPPAELLSRVLEQLASYSQAVETLCLRNEVPEATVSKLLQHQDSTVATAAAAGEWLADPRGTIRESLHQAWEHVVINHVTEAYWLKQVFQDDSALANAWLEHRLTREDYMLYRKEDSVKAAVDSLDLEMRKRLLRHVSPDLSQSAELLTYIIGDSLELYEFLLSSERLKALHLAPLHGYSGEKWVEKALLALDAGYSPEEIAQVVVRMPRTWSGEESTMWGNWMERIEPLCSNENENIRKIGNLGRERTKERHREALQRERKAAVFGHR